MSSTSAPDAIERRPPPGGGGAAEPGSTVTVIEPTSGWVALDLRSLIRHRELLYFLVWRTVKVRYKQTAVGALWAMLQPLLMAALFAVIFGHFGHLPSDGQPYFVFVYAAMLPWILFANALTQSSMSLVADKDLITKVYFPRLLVPVSSVLAALVDFAIGSVALVALMVVYGVPPNASLLALPVFALFALVTALAIGIWFSALNVRYRDVQYTIPFLTQFMLFATPIAYSMTLLPEKYRVVYGINPMAGVVEGFRWSIFRAHDEPQATTVVSAVAVLVLLVSGLAYFRRTERTFADVV
jgi:homopolymeric O-antigen transport system permease protein